MTMTTPSPFVFASMLKSPRLPCRHSRRSSIPYYVQTHRATRSSERAIWHNKVHAKQQQLDSNMCVARVLTS